MSGPRKAVVVGGGVVGACCAYYLARAGRSVTLIDAAGFGSGCSHANCGYICPSHALPLAAPGALRTILGVMARRNAPIRLKPGVLLRNPGWFMTFARRCNEPDMLSAGEAISALLRSSRSLYDELIRDEDIDCDWQTKGLLFVFRSPRAMEHHAEVDHLLRERFDMPARRLDPADLYALEPSVRPGLPGAWLYEHDAHLRPDRLMAELRRVLTGLGVTIHEHRAATGFVREGGRAVAVRTAAGDVPADDVVVALGAWTPALEREIGCRIPIQPGKGYSVTYRDVEAPPALPMIFEEDRVAVTPFADGFRIGSMMEFAGRDSTIDRRRLGVLSETSARYLKTRPIGEPEEEWFGWRPMTPDGLPIIGPSPALGNVLVAAGHNMLGMSMATATGKLAAEIANGARPHLDPAPYSADRFQGRSRRPQPRK
ncbi:MAG: amino acid dehydrogenase [Planctomycetales bacterium 71-10]|nr:MAG: amino acid dehydrogenase [Planctomycetales bacterium 71-10]